MTDKDKRSQAEIDASVRTQKIHVVGGTIGRAVDSISKWGCLAFVAWVFSPTIAQFAGKITDVSFLAVINSEGMPIVLLIGTCVVFGAGGIWYGRSQSSLRKSTVERLHKYQVKHETSVHPGRTTSKLTPRGDTRPEDQDG